MTSHITNTVPPTCTAVYHPHDQSLLVHIPAVEAEEILLPLQSAEVLLLLLPDPFDAERAEGAANDAYVDIDNSVRMLDSKDPKANAVAAAD